MDQAEVQAAVDAGHDAAHAARQAREELRWRVRKDDPQRSERIEQAIEAIDQAMKPIRSLIGKLVWAPQPDSVERGLRDVSQQLQYERRQLKKMRR